MIHFGAAYRGRRVLVTGHTGFKGSWLALWLQELGAEIAGFALPPETQPNHWDLLGIGGHDFRGDIRDAAAVQRCFDEFQPEIVFHLAAQALVRRSYAAPTDNWASNVMGTVNVLESCRQTGSVRAIVAVTTDKVYSNQEWQRGYREDDRLGGHDPYSASKAACEFAIDSYRKSFFSVEQPQRLLAVARAGNVIGGGDWSEDRLLPDLVRATQRGETLEIRSPSATRPWQHVLDCLSGYLQLGQRLLQGEAAFANAFNFGPPVADNCTVQEVLRRIQQSWPELVWKLGATPKLHEASLLYLDTGLAHEQLGWRPVWRLEQALIRTADWYRGWLNAGEVRSREQLQDYIAEAQREQMSWVI